MFKLLPMKFINETIKTHFTLLNHAKYYTNQCIQTSVDFVFKRVDDIPSYLNADTLIDANYNNNKILWLGLFNQELVILKEKITKKKFSIEKFAIKLFELQQLVGRKTVSPFDYIAGLKELSSNLAATPYVAIIKQILTN